jgi:hypothetical protein
LNTLRLKFSIRILIAGLIPIIFQCCAPVFVRPPSPPFDHQKIAHLVSSFEEQERRVQAFFSSGTLTVADYYSEFDADILIVATRDPLKIRIEVTHPWGVPIFHILIQEAHLQILSFPEKRYYNGHLGDSDPALNFFPLHLDPDQLWGLVRGYPILGEYYRVESQQGDQITLLNRELESVRIIDLYPQSDLPSLLSYPEQDIEVSFSDFENDEGIYYARNIIFNDSNAWTTLELNIKNMVLNKTIPEEVFDLKIPPYFERENSATR